MKISVTNSHYFRGGYCRKALSLSLFSNHLPAGMTDRRKSWGTSRTVANITTSLFYCDTRGSARIHSHATTSMQTIYYSIDRPTVDQPMSTHHNNFPAPSLSLLLSLSPSTLMQHVSASSSSLLQRLPGVVPAEPSGAASSAARSNQQRT